MNNRVVKYFSILTDHSPESSKSMLIAATLNPATQNSGRKENIVSYRKNPVNSVMTNPTANAALKRAIVLIAATENIFADKSRAYWPIPKRITIATLAHQAGGSRI